MSFYDVLASDTCFFYIRLSLAKNYYLVCDTSINPHLMKGGEIGSGTNLDMRKFLIYPEPGKDNQFRIQLKQNLPGQYVESSGNEGPFKPWKDKQDSDYQRFRFVNTSPPAKVPEGTPDGVDWYLIERVAGDQVLTWGGVIGKYAHAMTTAGKAKDWSKVWFEPVDRTDPAKKAETRNVEPVFPDEAPMFVARDVIPAALVNLPHKKRFPSKWDQIKKSPYYYLELKKFWKKTNPPVQLVEGGFERRTVKYTENYSVADYKSIQQTIGHIFKSELEAGYKQEGGGPYGSLKLSYEFSTQRKTDQSQTTTTASGEERSEEKTFSFSSGKGEKENHQAYQLIHSYALRSTEGEAVETWNYAEPNRIGWHKETTPA